VLSNRYSPPVHEVQLLGYEPLHVKHDVLQFVQMFPTNYLSISSANIESHGWVRGLAKYCEGHVDKQSEL